MAYMASGIAKMAASSDITRPKRLMNGFDIVAEREVATSTLSGAVAAVTQMLGRRL